MKTQVLADLNNLLNSYSLHSVNSDDCDLHIQHEFVNKNWLGGSKKIQYELMIGIDTKERIVYVLEKVIEQGSGFSFGMESSSYTQQGTKVYRKVRAKQMGLDGLAYEVDLDLGSILKEIKKIAKNHDYKFKEVMQSAKIKEAYLS